jgi:hypothetical protein
MLQFLKAERLAKRSDLHSNGRLLHALARQPRLIATDFVSV